ncbi:MAG: T9SS type A sorting domain-containing protein, partial [Bacteroidota bacterium]|nr:T9SS type A sorting domain-containing protein [Bacteroidota bacterium]
QLKMTSGQLDLQNATVDLGTAGIIVNETETNRIKVGNISTNTGTIQATRTINAVTDYNPANLGVLISTDVNMGSITIVRGHQVQQGSGLYTGNSSVARYYKIPNIGELDANDKVKLNYWDAELNGHTEANLEIYQWVEEGSTSEWWTPLSGSVASNLVSPDDTPYSDYFNPPNWYAFNYTELFTLGSKDTPLPVELVLFEGTCHGDFVTLEWETASEQNNEMFIIERSIDGVSFNVIGTIDGAGDSNQPLAYEFYDTKPLPKAYYRLRQVDFDGAFEYSNIINLSCTDVPDPMFTVYPNPFKTELHVMVSDLPEEAFLLELYTIEGKQIIQEKLFAPSEGLHKILQLDNLVPAMYVIRVISGDFEKSYRVEKQ